MYTADQILASVLTGNPLPELEPEPVDPNWQQARDTLDALGLQAVSLTFADGSHSAIATTEITDMQLASGQLSYKHHITVWMDEVEVASERRIETLQHTLDDVIRHEAAHVIHDYELAADVAARYSATRNLIPTSVVPHRNVLVYCLREVATGARSPHGSEWRKIARRLGATPAAHI